MATQELGSFFSVNKPINPVKNSEQFVMQITDLKTSVQEAQEIIFTRDMVTFAQNVLKSEQPFGSFVTVDFIPYKRK